MLSESQTKFNSHPEAGRIWRTDPEEIARILVPEWDLAPGETVLVRRSAGSTEEVEAVVQDV